MIDLAYLQNAGLTVANDNVDFARRELDAMQAAIVTLAWYKVANDFDYEAWLPGAVNAYTYPGFRYDLLADLGNDMQPYVDALVEELEANLAAYNLAD